MIAGRRRQSVSNTLLFLFMSSMSFVSPNSWELISLICKLGLYLGLCAQAGCLVNLAFYNDGSRRTTQGLLRYGLLGSVLGFKAVLLNYLVQVGMINANGVAGMFDWAMIQLLLDTPQGESTLWRLLGFTLALLTAVWALQFLAGLRKPPTSQQMRLILLPLIFALLIQAGSFQMSGHVAVLGTSGQLAIALHVMAFAYWIGSLLPLYWLSLHQSGKQLQWHMARFGDHARLILLVLLLAGGLMLWQLLHSPSELLQTPYGLSLLLKLLLVAGLMAIAAHNRFALVPQLVPALESDTTQSDAARLRLRSSIKMEMLLALAILAVTAYLSTLVGPMDHA